MFPLLFAKLHSVSSRNNFQCESASSEPFLQVESLCTFFCYLIEENIEEVTKLDLLWLVLSLNTSYHKWWLKDVQSSIYLAWLTDLSTEFCSSWHYGSEAVCPAFSILNYLCRIKSKQTTTGKWFMLGFQKRC